LVSLLPAPFAIFITRDRYLKDLLASFFLIGFGFGLIYLPAIVSVTCYFEKKRSFATGIAVCGSGLGTFIFAPLTGILIQAYFWKGAMLIIAAITLNCVIFGALFRPLDNKPRPKPTTDEVALEMAEKEKLMAITEESSAANSPTEPIQVPSNLIRRSVHDVPLNGKSLEEENNKNNFLSVSMDSSAAARMAQSQPHLLQVPDMTGDESRKFGSYGNLPSRKQGDAEACSISPSRKSSVADLPAGSGVMYRKDALYSGSMLNIPEYRANPDGFSGSMMRIPEDVRSVGSDAVDDKVKVMGCIPCDRESYHAYKEMMDFSLFKDPIFILFTVSNFCTSIGFNVPYVYIKVFNYCIA